MSEDVDTLLAIAEIAGVFVGFAALVTFITRSGGTDDRPASVFLLTNVIFISVLIIVAALVPAAFYLTALVVALIRVSVISADPVTVLLKSERA